MPDSPQVWTTRKLLRWTTDYFKRIGIDPPRLAAEMLLAHVLEVDRLHLYTDADRPASEIERAAFRDLVERAAKHEPVDYLVGWCPFFGMTLKVTRDVLIPRPSTETLVEHVVAHAQRTPGFHAPRIADVGTGSGAIAIALAKHIPSCSVLATDISEAALAVARENAKAVGVSEHITFVQGDLLEPLEGGTFHFLVSNPPYISDKEWDDVAPNVKDHEPTGALRGGFDGLEHIRKLVKGGPAYLETPGELVVEIAASQKSVVLEMAAANADLRDEVMLYDHGGLPRVLVAGHNR